MVPCDPNRSQAAYRVISSGHFLIVEQTGDEVTFHCPNDEFAFWEHYFDLKTDYDTYIRAIDPMDDYLSRAAAFGSGIRILNQDLWEMMITFLISQQKTIPKIREAVEALAKKYGAKRTAALSDGSIRTYYSFPSPEELASASLDDLLTLKLGYRAKYICAAARQVASGAVDLEAVRHMDYAHAKAELLRLTGVGIKVAECICLFALHHIDAFPVDTHIRQMLDAHYPKGFPLKRYKGFAGVMQQYAFYYELSLKD